MWCWYNYPASHPSLYQEYNYTSITPMIVWGIIIISLYNHGCDAGIIIPFIQWCMQDNYLHPYTLMGVMHTSHPSTMYQEDYNSFWYNHGCDAGIIIPDTIIVCWNNYNFLHTMMGVIRYNYPIQWCIRKNYNLPAYNPWVWCWKIIIPASPMIVWRIIMPASHPPLMGVMLV